MKIKVIRIKLKNQIYKVLILIIKYKLNRNVIKIHNIKIKTLQK